MVVGVALGELLYDKVGLRWAMACAGLLLLPVAGLLLATFPETKRGGGEEVSCGGGLEAVESDTEDEGGDDDAIPPGPLRGLKRSMALFISTPRITKLATATFALAVGIYGVQSIVLYYGEDVFDLGSIDIMIVLFEATLIAPACSFVAVRYIIPAYGAADTFAGLSAVSLFGAIFIGLAPTAVLFYVATPFFFVGYAVLPIAFGPMANEIKYKDQGRFQGAIYGLCTVASLVGYYVFLVLYQHTYDSVVPGTVFLAVAAINVAAVFFYHAAGDAPPGTGTLSEAVATVANEGPKTPLLPARDREDAAAAATAVPVNEAATAVPVGEAYQRPEGGSS